MYQPANSAERTRRGTQNKPIDRTVTVEKPLVERLRM